MTIVVQQQHCWILAVVSVSAFALTYRYSTYFRKYQKQIPSQKDPKSTGLLILIRHGQSVWNRKPDLPEKLWRYAGSVDVPLRYAVEIHLS